jgi:hypothetical protein
MSVGWVQIGEDVWVLEDERVIYSAIIQKDGNYVIMNAGLGGGDAGSLQRAMENAEDYWVAQAIGPLSYLRKPVAAATGVGEAIAQPVPVTGTAESWRHS